MRTKAKLIRISAITLKSDPVLAKQMIDFCNLLLMKKRELND